MVRGDGVSTKAGSNILYLLEISDFSTFHRIKQDEMWCYGGGRPMVVVELTAAGVRETRVGPLHDASCQVNHVVRAGTWFAAHPLTMPELSTSTAAEPYSLGKLRA